MDTRRLLSTTVLYGVADMVVLAVGGFLLIPLYTRTLSQAEFGTYVIFRANTEIVTYLLFLGMPSAVARLYFEYHKKGEQHAYLSSVMMFFGLALLVFGAVLALWGAPLWALLSPGVPADPYLGFSLAIAATGFLGAIGTTWLRMEGRALAFAGVQVAASLVLAGVAVVNLLLLGRGLTGLLWAMLVSSACAALVLPWLFGARFRPLMRWAHIRASLHYALPIVVGYAAYFVLNRINTVILQRHVEVDQVAIFGLAQQLAMLVSIAAMAFGKAMQPAVFAAEPAAAAALMLRIEKLFILLMSAITGALVLFSAQVFALMAPPSYAGGQGVLLVLLLASFAYSFTLISDTALLYHQRPKTSVAITLAGAAVAAALGLLLIPAYQLYGAAGAIFGGFLTMALLSHQMARRVTGHAYLAPMALALAALGALAALVAWFDRQGWATAPALAVKAALLLALAGAAFGLYARQGGARPA
ncbi:MAG: lipopolysaccharide biosynthesis protein [Pseudomonadota bacterium]